MHIWIVMRQDGDPDGPDANHIEGAFEDGKRDAAMRLAAKCAHRDVSDFRDEFGTYIYGDEDGDERFIVFNQEVE